MQANPETNIFKNTEELNETFTILNTAYGNYWTIYKPFTIVGNTITFAADAFYDPVLTLFKLRLRGIINAEVDSFASETDKFIIKGCNLSALREIYNKKPDFKTVDTMLDSFGFEKPAEKKTADDDFIVLEEEKGPKRIPGKVWNQYWAAKGKSGPESGWDIPTSKEIYSTVRLFAPKVDTNTEKQPQPAINKLSL